MEQASVLNLESVPFQAPEVVGRTVKDEAILVMPEKGKVKVLNQSGARIWEMVDGRRSIRQIAAQICQEYEVEATEAEMDALAFIRDLVERGVLKIANPSEQLPG